MDWGRVRLWNKKHPFHFGFQKDNMAISPNGGGIYFEPGVYSEDFSGSTRSMAFLIHELVRVWQKQFLFDIPTKGLQLRACSFSRRRLGSNDHRQTRTRTESDN